MDPDRWKQVDNMLQAALERPPAGRADFLRQACAGDRALEQEVRSLLASQQEAGSFLESSAMDAAAPKPALNPSLNPDDATQTIYTLIDRTISHYRIIEKLGSGGMGVVYKAEDSRLGRFVALKFLSEEFAHDSAWLSRFQREARILASLNHPRIAAIYGLEESDGLRAIAMELVEGPTLAERMERGRIPVVETLAIAAQIVEAVEYAHEQGIVHRDLKPANVKLRPDGAIKVLDFGLAKAADAKEIPAATATHAGVVMGTPAYMAPEQASGLPVDRRADIWSFGVVLFEMLAGCRVYGRRTGLETLAAVARDEPPWDQLPEETPGPIVRLLRRCLDKDPQRRLRDIGEARIAIEEARTAPSVAPSPERTSSARILLEAPPPAATFRRAPWVIAAAVLVAAIVAAFGWWRATRSAEAPIMGFDLDLGPNAVVGPRITTTISPDGSRLAYLAQGPNGKPQIATRALDQSQATLLAGTEDATDPFFSPDGQWIGFFAGGQMKKTSVQGGGAVTLCEAGGQSGAVRGASWGEDHQIVLTAAAGPAIGLSRVPDTGGTPVALTKPALGEVSHRWPQILPGGKAILFTSTATVADYEDGFIEALSLKTGKWKVIQRGGYFGRYLPSGHLVFVHQGTLFAVPFDLERVEVKGTPVPVLENVDASAFYASGQFESSRNGIFIYARGRSDAAGWPIAWLDSSSTTKPLLLSAPNYTPLFSPDGKRLMTRLQGDYQVYDLEHDRTTRLTFNRTNFGGRWAPDGKHVVFAAQSSGGTELRWIRSDGAGQAQSLFGAKESLIPWSFTPDGKRLAFTMGVAGPTHTWILPLDLTDPENPKPGKPELFVEATSPAFSPDGRWIAYTGAESGLLELYVRPFPGPGGKAKVSTSGGQFPIWSRTRQELFFESPDLRIMVADYTASGDSFDAGKPRQWSSVQLIGLNQTQTFDLAPDGKRFAVSLRPEVPGQNGRPQVTVILNFFDLLRRRAPAGK
jgi:Tol biopolymer transport system component